MADGLGDRAESQAGQVLAAAEGHAQRKHGAGHGVQPFDRRMITRLQQGRTR